jgi:signal transduction histidine kinase
MNPTKSEQLNALSEFLGAQRDTILQCWRKAADSDPKQTTVRALTRGQFNDHIPEMLDAFERRLRALPGDAADQAAVVASKKEEVKHGLHRWQQGYRLQELMHEWGHLQVCIFQAVETFAAAHREFERETLVEANHLMITLVNEAMSESTAQYERMQQAEASGRLSAVEGALASISEIERRRAALIHEAVHDINGNVYSVAMAAKILGEPDIPAGDRADFTQLLDGGVQAVSDMLNELKELARLEAGREIREVSEFDAAALVRDLGRANRPIAADKGLFLEVAGPDALPVCGDPGKVRRLLQNLLLNALKYTGQGGVTLSLGREEETWWLMVKDTGPGIPASPDAPMVIGLREATASARESDEKAAASAGKISQVLVPALGRAGAMYPTHQQPGEGIGLSIVKRLCELLDASLEMESSAGRGTTFRVVLPRHYPRLASGKGSPPAGSGNGSSG